MRQRPPRQREHAAWQTAAVRLIYTAQLGPRAVVRASWRFSVCSTPNMLTTEELASIPLFASVPVGELEHLARGAADIQLVAGEYAVHEGEERALFAVLSGKIEVTKRIDGIERTIGWRMQGKIFGEVPIALGGPFIGSYRACGPSRVVRIDAKHY